VPAGACDCHVHVFGPASRFPYAQDRVYTPDDAPLADLVRHLAAIEVDRVVIVQPSPYGSDNRCTVDGLRQLGGRGRGVAVVADDAALPALEDLHRAGVRGIRLNLETSSVHDPEVARQRLIRDAQRLAPLGWHIQREEDGLALSRAARWVPDATQRRKFLVDNPQRLYDF